MTHLYLIIQGILHTQKFILVRNIAPIGQVSTQYETRSMVSGEKFDSEERWEEYREAIPNFDRTSLRANMLLEHMNTTKDESDYLWYTLR